MSAGCRWTWGLTLCFLLSVGCPHATSVHHRDSWQQRSDLVQEEDLIRSILADITEEKVGDDSQSEGEEAGRMWMRETNELFRQEQHLAQLAQWSFVTNITQQTQAAKLEADRKLSQWMRARQTMGRQFPYHTYSPDLHRQFWLFTKTSDSSDPEISATIDRLKSAMITTYNTATVCLSERHSQNSQDSQDKHHSFLSERHSQNSQDSQDKQHGFLSERHSQNSQDSQDKQHGFLSERHSQNSQDSQDRHHGCLSLEPDLQKLMAESRDPEVLKRVWEGWREAAQTSQRQRYSRFVSLLNDGARENGYSDYAEYLQGDLFKGNTDVEKMAEDMWQELRPLYLQLQAYVRRQLRQEYGVKVVGSDGTIPAHLLGNMWAQSWEEIYPMVMPYPQQTRSVKDIDRLLKDRYDVKGLFRLSEDFYASMGLFNMTDLFWERSMLVKPPDRDVQCHASASDFLSPGDFRIKMCTEVTRDYLNIIHHEMGHIEYFMAYADQPTVYRSGANCAFHEAIGDTVSLSVLSRTHLKMLELDYSDHEDTDKQDMNDMMLMALHKVAFLPFGLMVDRWRWQVFRGQTTPSHYNRDWWKLRLELQGLRSPVPRSEKDFDPIAKFHVPANVPYICYFISYVAQFQFYRTLCQASGHQGPLHLCDFYGSTHAGHLFKRLLASGSSRPWQDVMEEFTGSPDISVEALLEYFEPLHQWLREDNERNGETLGWEGATINWEEGEEGKEGKQ